MKEGRAETAGIYKIWQQFYISANILFYFCAEA